MTERETPSILAATRVKPGREDDFTHFVTHVVGPAVYHARPHLAGMWQLWRPSSEPLEGGTRAFVLAFYGEARQADWDIDTLLADAHGKEEGQRLSERLKDMIEDQTLYGIEGDL